MKEKTRTFLFSLWKEGCSRLFENRLAIFSLIFLSLVILFCFFGPYLSPYSYHGQDLDLGADRPTWSHWFGTDLLGRDLFTRILYGGRISLAVGLAATLVSLTIGVLYGSISGLIGGRLDSIMMRFIDIIYPMPFTLVVILLMVYCGRNIILLFMAIGCMKWLTMARIVRNQILTLKNQQFVEASRSIGQTSIGILKKHMIPNLFGIIIVYATLNIPSILLEEAFLSFLGLGVQPPMSSWGLLILDGANSMEVYPWLLIFPSVFFSLTLFCFNFLGDGLRDALDPRSNKK